MPTNLNNFLHSLIKWMLAQAAVNAAAAVPPVAFTPPVYVGPSPRDVFRHRAIEADASSCYTTFRFYGGPAFSKTKLPCYSLQCQTVATADLGGDAALDRTQMLFETLIVPGTLIGIAMQQILGFTADTDQPDLAGNWMVVAYDPLQRPGIIGVDDRERSIAVFNGDISFYQYPLS